MKKWLCYKLTKRYKNYKKRDIRKLKLTNRGIRNDNHNEGIRSKTVDVRLEIMITNFHALKISCKRLGTAQFELFYNV